MSLTISAPAGCMIAPALIPGSSRGFSDIELFDCYAASTSVTEVHCKASSVKLFAASASDSSGPVTRAHTAADDEVPPTIPDSPPTVTDIQPNVVSPKIAPTKTVVVLGKGDIGKAFTDMLDTAGAHVQALEINPAVRGDNVSRDWAGVEAKLQAEGRSLHDVDYVIVTVLAGILPQVVNQIPMRLRHKLVFVQNGFGYDKTVEAIAGVRYPTYGALYISVKEGHVEQLMPSPFHGPRADELAAIFNEGVSDTNPPFAAAAADARAFLVTKLMKGIINTYYNALCPIYQADVEITYDSFGIERTTAMAEELAMVINAIHGEDIITGEMALAGIQKARHGPWKNEAPTTYYRFWGYKIPKNVQGMSMEDLEKIPKLEPGTEFPNQIDFMLGYIIAQAKALGLIDEIPVCVEVYRDLMTLKNFLVEGRSNGFEVPIPA